MPNHGKCGREGCTNEKKRNDAKYCSKQCFYANRRNAQVECAAPDCDNVFTRSSLGKGYCSKSCAAAARRAWKERKCALDGCDNIISVRRNKYCSKECAYRAIRLAVGPWHECELPGCTGKVKPYAKRIGQRFCSITCAGKHRTAEDRQCALDGCLGIVKDRRKRVRYCSRACYEKSRQTPEVTCRNPGCGLVFRPTSNSGRYYCSRSCSSAHMIVVRRVKSLLILSDAVKTGKLQKILEDAE